MTPRDLPGVNMRPLGKPSKRSVLVVLVGLAILTYVLGPRTAGSLRGIVQPILAPLGDGGMYLATAMKMAFAPAGISPEQARQLKRENALLSGLAAYWKDQAHLHRRRVAGLITFQKSYGPLADLQCELIPARVVAEDSLPYGQTRSLNVGQKDKAVARAPVISAEPLLLTDRSKALPTRLAVVTGSALVGRLSQAGAFTSRMTLITDRAFGTRARILRIIDPRNPRKIVITTGGQAAEENLSVENNFLIEVEARGDGAGGLVISDVSEYHNIRPDDMLLTAEDRYLPVPVRIGRIYKVQKNPRHPLREIIWVRPDATLESLRDVYIVVPLGPGPLPDGDRAG